MFAISRRTEDKMSDDILHRLPSENGNAQLREQLIEYQSQIKDLDEVLEDSPTDESVLALKRDLLELISLTEAEMKEEASVLSTKSAPIESALVADHGNSNNENDSNSSQENSTLITKVEHIAEDSVADASSLVPTTAESKLDDNATTQLKKKKASSKSNNKLLKSTFEAPPHLVVVDSDSATEKNRKRRALKALKTKWHFKKKEAEGAEKQKSWQSFMDKGTKKKRKGIVAGTSKSGEGSIFRTEDGVNARVGVIGSGRSMTEYVKRTKH